MSQFGYELQAHTSGDEPHQLFLFFVVKKDCTFATNLDTILMHYLYLTLAIVLEVLATTLLGKSEGFTKWLFAGKQVWKSELSRILFSFWMKGILFPLLLVIVRK